jgi:tetratricopeptide (TPR) repeat protein
VPNEQKTVFISYRRSTGEFIARSVFQDLRTNDYDPFMDVESINSGTFDTIILHQIEARRNFVIILTPDTLERCVEPDDWLRREIEYAIDTKRIIVPLFCKGFNFKGQEKYLTGKLSQLLRYNGLTIYHEYFDEAMARLRKRFFEQLMDGIVVDTPNAEKSVVQQKIEEIISFPAPKPEQWPAEEYFHRGLKRKRNRDFSGAMSDYYEAIRLYPHYGEAYNNLGIIHKAQDNIDAAISDYTAAISINPRYFRAYNNRGVAKRHKNDFDGAMSDYNQSLYLNPQYPSAYHNRGELYFILSKYKTALEDFNNANRLRSNYNITLAGLAITHHALGNIDEALKLWRQLLEKDELYRDTEWVRKELNWTEPLVEEAKKLIARL